jgi:2-hydroxy-3-oxopropionate reductase
MAITLRNQKVAVVGLGAIGSPVAVNLAKKGVQVEVWNRTKEKCKNAISAGATEISELEKIDSAIVLTALPDYSQVEALLESGLNKALRSWDFLVVMGTVSPVAIKSLGAKLSKLGVNLVDAPVSGGDVGAQNGTLSIMVGGTFDQFETLLETFKKIGGTIKHLGPLGAGEMAKACNQIVVAVTLSALAEAITLGRNAGLDSETLVDILAGGLANSQVLQVKKEKILSNDFTLGGSAAFQLKDLNFALEAGTDTGTALPTTNIVTQLFKSLIEAGDGQLDHSSIIREIERRSN